MSLVNGMRRQWSALENMKLFAVCPFPVASFVKKSTQTHDRTITQRSRRILTSG